MRVSERRSEIRLPLPGCTVSSARGAGRLLNVSSAGVAVEVKTRCIFARGELHRLVLSDLSQSVEVEGLVCWTQSDWRSSQRSPGSEYVQTAGLEISRLLTDQPAGIWSNLLTGLVKVPTVVDSPETQPLEIPKQAPPLRMIEPVNGSIVSREAVNVICILDRPELITGVRINGIEALVMGDLGTAEVKLHQGANRVVSMVSRRDGTYSTYLLGRVVRWQTP